MEIGILQSIGAAADKIESLEAEIERLEALLRGRDDFIVNRGLWSDFMNTLPRNPAHTAGQRRGD